MNLDQFTAPNAPTESADPFQRENSYALDVEVNRGLSDMFGQESGERYRTGFDGPGGFVVVQPSEEHV